MVYNTLGYTDRITVNLLEMDVPDTREVLPSTRPLEVTAKRAPLTTGDPDFPPACPNWNWTAYFLAHPPSPPHTPYSSTSSSRSTCFSSTSSPPACLSFDKEEAALPLELQHVAKLQIEQVFEEAITLMEETNKAVSDQVAVLEEMLD